MTLQNWLVLIVIWMLMLTVVVGFGMRGLYGAYIKTLQENMGLRSQLNHVEVLAAEQVRSLQEKFRMAVDALRREIIDLRERWTISAYRQMDAELYIEVLEESHHAHSIALPPKPKRAGIDRPITEPTNIDQYRDLDFIDELLSPVAAEVAQQPAGVKL